MCMTCGRRSDVRNLMWNYGYKLGVYAKHIIIKINLML
jgi:hypothetical protein